MKGLETGSLESPPNASRASPPAEKRDAPGAAPERFEPPLIDHDGDADRDFVRAW